MGLLPPPVGTDRHPEWQAIVKPRTIVEIIDGQRVEYADPMWLPSATDVFGPSDHASRFLMNTKLWASSHIPISLVSSQIFRSSILRSFLSPALSRRGFCRFLIRCQPLDTVGTVTVVCGYSDSCAARFVLKDCWDEAVMNEEATNKGGYFKSKGRANRRKPPAPAR